MINKLLFEDWITAQGAKLKGGRKFPKKFIGERGYPHFDSKIFYPRTGNNQEQLGLIRETLTDLDKPCEHGFLPFVEHGMRTRKYTKPYDYDFSAIRGRDQKLFPHIKSRPIMYASHKDACIYSYYCFVMEQLYEKELLDKKIESNVIAYRSIDGKNNIDFAKEAFDEMKSRSEFDSMMIDVKGFFDNLSHDQLKKRWEELLSGGFKANKDHEYIYENITSYRSISNYRAIELLKKNRKKFLFVSDGSYKLASLNDYNDLLKSSVKKNRSGIGIPQGSPISGILANLYLIKFDEEVASMINRHGGLYQRYSDDILIICPIGTAKDIYDEVVRLLSNESLKLGKAKTEAFRKHKDQELLLNVTHEVEPTGNAKKHQAQYLGFHFNGKNITIRPSTISKHMRKKSKPSYLFGSHKKTKDIKLGKQVNKVQRKVAASGE